MNEKNTKEEPKTVEEPVKEEKYEDIDKEDSLVQEATKFIPTYLCGGMFLKLGEDNKKITDFTSLEKLNMIVSLYEQDIIKTATDYSVYSIDESELSK